MTPLALLIAGGVTFAQSPFVGSWKLNLAKSKYTNVDPPKSRTMTFTNLPDGTFRHDASWVTSTGESRNSTYTARRDGKEYSMTGARTYDSLIITKPTEFSDQWTLKLKGEVVATGETVMAKDKKTLTMRWQGKNAQGQPASSVTLFERQ